MQLTKTIFAVGAIFAVSVSAADATPASDSTNITESQLWSALESYFKVHPVNLTQIDHDLAKHRNETAHKHNGTHVEEPHKHNATAVDEHDNKHNATAHHDADKHKANSTAHHEGEHKPAHNATAAHKPAAHKIFEEHEPLRCCKCPWKAEAKEEEKISMPHVIIDFTVELALPSVLECCSCPEEKVKNATEHGVKPVGHPKKEDDKKASTTVAPKAAATSSGFQTVTTIKA
jgi:hypothetical protein